MSDPALASLRIREVAGDRPAGQKLKSVLEDVYGTLTKAYPKSGWTRRRVRSLWGEEAARVDYREIAEMEAVIAEAERKHAAYVNETAERRARAASLIAALELQDEEFHRGSIEGLRGVMRGMADPRDRKGRVG